jgi:hypothetical protein
MDTMDTLSPRKNNLMESVTYKLNGAPQYNIFSKSHPVFYG